MYLPCHSSCCQGVSGCRVSEVLTVSGLRRLSSLSLRCASPGLAGGWADLPHDCLLAIMQRFASKNDAAVMRCVCRSWRHGFDQTVRCVTLHSNVLLLPQSPSRFPNMQHLVVSHISHSGAQAAIRMLALPAAHLCILELSHSMLSSVPPDLHQLQGLRTLVLSSNRLKELKAAKLHMLPQLGHTLRKLNVSENSLGFLPEGLGGLTELRSLRASNNVITELPDSLAQLQALTMLDLSLNRFKSIPEGLTRMTQLRHLGLFAAFSHSLRNEGASTAEDRLVALIKLRCKQLRLAAEQEAEATRGQLHWFMVSILVLQPVAADMISDCHSRNLCILRTWRAASCILFATRQHSRHGPATAAGSSRQPGSHPAVMSLQREVGIAQDTSALPETRVASLTKLHAVMAAHQANRPGLAVAMLPWFLSGWPHLVACLWDINPQLPAAVAPLLGMVGGAVLRDLLDLLLGWSLEPGLPHRDSSGAVNMYAAGDGSTMRPAVGKAVMAFFAGNKKVCDDWLTRQGEASTISGLHAWVHSTFYATWRAVSRFYALDLSLDGDSSGLGLGGAHTEPQPDLDPAAGWLLQQRAVCDATAAAAEAYCNYLAAAVNAKALASPEQGLGVLLRLLQTILQHGDALQPQLQQALGSSPAAAWQVLTPQLLGQLQHASAAVRALVQQLLQGLALVVPCSVLYPLIVEVRAAQEAGQEGLTVTPREAWAGLLVELGLEVDRKLLALQADAVRLVQQGLSRQRRTELITNSEAAVAIVFGLQVPHRDGPTTALPPLPLRATLNMYKDTAEAGDQQLPLAGAALAADAAEAGMAASRGSWLCIAGFDHSGGEGKPDGSSGVVLPLMVAAARPADAFYARLLPALQSAGVSVGAARSSWPAARVTKAAACPAAAVSCSHARCLVVQPAVLCRLCSSGQRAGWLLGLGDRHLDNLLLDTESGELLHIDFSAALGPGGLAGPFSAAAATVLSVLRGSSELLTTLLALLLADPAVDWSVEREAHAARKDQDTGVSLKLFASSVKVYLQHVRVMDVYAAAAAAVGSGCSWHCWKRQVQGLLAPPYEWDVAACDRSLLLLVPNVDGAAAEGPSAHTGVVRDDGILARSLAPATTSSTATIGPGRRPSQQQCRAPAGKPWQQQHAQHHSCLVLLMLPAPGPAWRPVGLDEQALLVLQQVLAAAAAGIAGMLLEGSDELGGALEDAEDEEAATAGAEVRQQDDEAHAQSDDDGLDWLLEEQQAQEAASSRPQRDLAAVEAASEGLPELVPFDAFDPSLPGAGAVLEAGSSGAGTSEGAAAVTASAVAAAAAAALKPGDAFQWYFSQPGLLQLLPRHPDQAGDSSCASLPLSHLLEPTQQSQGSAGVAAGSSSLLRMPGRAELLGAWQEVSESLSGLEAGLTAWQEAGAAAAGGVEEAVARLAAQAGVVVGDTSVCFKVLHGLCTRSRRWCSAAAGLLAGVSRLGEAALQLECSRRGRLWAPGMPDGVDAFQGNASLLQQLHSTAAALSAAETEAAAAEALLASSQAAGQQAEAAADEAAQEEAAAEHQLALKTPAALARAQALTSVLCPMVESAESALGLVTGGTGSTLRALQTLVEKNSAARDLAPVAAETLAQHARCVAVLQRLHGIGAAAAAGLQEALLLNQQQQQVQPAEQLQGGEQQQQRRLLELLLQHMSPALQGVKDELHELGQAHVLLTQLTHQLDSLAAAAETVAAAISADHAMQMAAGPGSGKQTPAAAAAAASGSSVRRARAEARRRAFAAAALARCTGRLAGKHTEAGNSSSSSSSRSGAASQPQTIGIEESSSTGGAAVGAVSEVSALIAAATSVDKLSRMYEGWAAWL
ncbi:hypothetical protein COO60DRAFT_1628668 [Scenedesmus sp. NREL 46B-D3]|nr:hypothetical protein COO60DRAFT_1628668 [Scenedesmus sp. NREL 46B-D3]